MSITVAATSQQITANVSGSTVQAAVSGSQVTASASGGFGPPGPPGSAGAISSLADIGDVAIDSVAAGDVLRYSTNKWRNYPEVNLVDGGNW